MHLLFKLLELLLLRLLLLLLDVGLGDVGGSGALRDGLALEACRGVRFHSSAQSLRCAWHISARSQGAALVRRGRWLGLYQESKSVRDGLIHFSEAPLCESYLR